MNPCTVKRAQCDKIHSRKLSELLI